MSTQYVALLYKDRKQGQLFLKSKILQGSDNFAYNKKDGVTRVWSPDGNIVEYILCQCEMNSVMRRFCGMHLSSYIVTDPYQMYDGEPLLFVASRVR